MCLMPTFVPGLDSSSSLSTSDFYFSSSKLSPSPSSGTQSLFLPVVGLLADPVLLNFPLVRDVCLEAFGIFLSLPPGNVPVT